jgi:uncharacterized protein (TIGR03546 family)
MGAAFTMAFFFAFIAYIFDPIFHDVGVMILEMDGLQSTFVTLYNLPIIPFTKFYNTVVMGANFVCTIGFHYFKKINYQVPSDSAFAHSGN